MLKFNHGTTGHGGLWNTEGGKLMHSCELQNCQWATLVDLEIFSQIGICLLFASEYHCLHLCSTLNTGELRTWNEWTLYLCSGVEGKWGWQEEVSWWSSSCQQFPGLRGMASSSSRGGVLFNHLSRDQHRVAPMLNLHWTSYQSPHWRNTLPTSLPDDATCIAIGLAEDL